MKKNNDRRGIIFFFVRSVNKNKKLQYRIVCDIGPIDFNSNFIRIRQVNKVPSVRKQQRQYVRQA